MRNIGVFLSSAKKSDRSGRFLYKHGNIEQRYRDEIMSQAKDSPEQKIAENVYYRELSELAAEAVPSVITEAKLAFVDNKKPFDGRAMSIQLAERFGENFKQGAGFDKQPKTFYMLGVLQGLFEDHGLRVDRSSTFNGKTPKLVNGALLLESPDKTVIEVQPVPVVVPEEIVLEEEPVEVLPTITLETGETVSVQYETDGSGNIDFLYEVVVKDGEKTIKGTRRFTPDGQEVRVKYLKDRDTQAVTYFFQKADEKNSQIFFDKNDALYFYEPGKGFIPAEYKGVNKRAERIYELPSGRKMTDAGEQREGVLEHIQNRSSIGAGVNVTPGRENIPTGNLSYQYYNQVGLGASVHTNAKDRVGGTLNYTKGIDLGDLTPKQKNQLKKFLKVDDEQLKNLEKLNLAEFQFVVLAGYEKNAFGEDFLQTFHLEVDPKAHTIRGLGAVDLNAKINLHKLKTLDFLPQASFTSKYLEAFASAQYQSAYVMIPFKKGKWNLLLGGASSYGDVRPGVGFKTVGKSGRGKRMVAQFSANQIMGFEMGGNSVIYGDEVQRYTVGPLGMQLFEIQNPGKLEVTSEGEVVAYNRVGNKNDIDFLFQYIQKTPKTTKILENFGRAIDPMTQVSQLYFSPKILRKIQKERELLDFTQNFSSLSPLLLENRDKIDSIVVHAWESNRKNYYDPRTGDLHVYNFKNLAKNPPEISDPESSFMTGDEALDAALKNLSITVQSKKELSADQKVGLRNFLALATHFPQKFVGKDIRIARTGILKGIGDFFYHDDRPNQNPVITIHPKALEQFDTNILTEVTRDEQRPAYFFAEPGEQLGAERFSDSQMKTIDAFGKAIENFDFALGFSQVIFLHDDEFEAKSFTPGEAKTKRFGVVGNTLYVNVDDLKDKNILKGFKRVVGKHLFTSLKKVQDAREQSDRAKLFVRNAGIKTSVLYHLKPAAPIKYETDQKTITYRLSDVYEQSVLRQFGDKAGDTFEIILKKNGEKVLKFQDQAFAFQVEPGFVPDEPLDQLVDNGNITGNFPVMEKLLRMKAFWTAVEDAENRYRRKTDH